MVTIYKGFLKCHELGYVWRGMGIALFSADASCLNFAACAQSNAMNGVIPLRPLPMGWGGKEWGGKEMSCNQPGVSCHAVA